MDKGYVLGVLVAMGGVTFLLRALPFFAAQWLRRHALVERLGRFLPLAIMTLLLLHTGATSAAQHAHGPWFELIALACVIVLQLKRGNALFSMLVGTLVYVALRNGF
jgi:branched-subunit amino acid transport protein AzlD